MSGSNMMFSPKYGVCYMFNSVNEQNGDKSLVVDKSGPESGLRLEMDVESKYDSSLALIIGT